jgi:hypothetical protein
MLTQEERLSWLGDLLDRLGPGVALHVDLSVLRIVFSPPAGEPNDLIIETARTFAQERQCAFRFETHAEQGVFGRAFFKNAD